MVNRWLKKDNISFFAGSLLCVVLVFLSLQFPKPLAGARQSFSSVMAPVFVAFRQPSIWTDEAIFWLASYSYTAKENRQLKQQIEALQQYRLQAEVLAEQVQQLKNVLETAKNFPGEPVAARVLTDATSPYVRSLLVDVGTGKGVAPGQEVLFNGAMVGRVVSANVNTARVLLLTDYTFRMPVRMVESRVRGLARGTNSHTMELMLLEKDSPVQAGELVVTSGAEGMLVADIPVGQTVLKADKVMIQPFVDTTRLDYVAIMRRPVQGILYDTETPLAGSKGTP